MPIRALARDTHRVQLEPLTAGHAAELFRGLADPAIYEYIPGEPPASVEALAERYRLLESRSSPDGSQRWLNWVIRRIEDRQCIGYIQATVYPDTTADFAFMLVRGFWGLGFAQEASAQVLTWLFGQFGVTCVYATVDKRNTRSSTLLERLGFLRVAPASYPHGSVAGGDDVFRLNRNT